MPGNFDNFEDSILGDLSRNARCFKIIQVKDFIFGAHHSRLLELIVEFILRLIDLVNGSRKIITLKWCELRFEIFLGSKWNASHQTKLRRFHHDWLGSCWLLHALVADILRPVDSDVLIFCERGRPKAILIPSMRASATRLSAKPSQTSWSQQG